VIYYARHFARRPDYPSPLSPCAPNSIQNRSKTFDQTRQRRELERRKKRDRCKRLSTKFKNSLDRAELNSQSLADRLSRKRPPIQGIPSVTDPTASTRRPIMLAQGNLNFSLPYSPPLSKKQSHEKHVSRFLRSRRTHCSGSAFRSRTVRRIGRSGRGADGPTARPKTGLFDLGEDDRRCSWITKASVRGTPGHVAVGVVLHELGNIFRQPTVIAIDADNATSLETNPITDGAPKHGYDGSRTTPTVDG